MLDQRGNGGSGKVRMFQGKDSIVLSFEYPLAVKYRFIHELLHHLVTTINKSSLNFFLAKLDTAPQQPLLTLYYTFHHHSPPDTPNQTPDTTSTPITSLFALSDLIYHKILLLCEAYTIEHSPLAKGYELLEYMSSRVQQQRLFLQQTNHLSARLAKSYL